MSTYSTGNTDKLKMETLDIMPPDQVSKTKYMAKGGGTKPYLWQPVIASPSHPTKDGRATDSCFTLIGAHQCGVLMVNAG